MGYSSINDEVGFYTSSFLSYDSIVEFLELVEFCHVDRSDFMFVKSCRESERVFMRTFLCETHFMYMYSSFFSTLHHIVPFYKFEVDVLSELNIAPAQLHLKAWAALCTLKVLCDVFSIIPIAPKFIYHYIMKENKKGGWISLIGITDKAIITNSYKKFKGNFFQVCLSPESMPIYFS